MLTLNSNKSYDIVNVLLQYCLLTTNLIYFTILLTSIKLYTKRNERPPWKIMVRSQRSMGRVCTLTL